MVWPAMPPTLRLDVGKSLLFALAGSFLCRLKPWTNYSTDCNGKHLTAIRKSASRDSKMSDLHQQAQHGQGIQ